jgi:hypothetical protein
MPLQIRRGTEAERLAMTQRLAAGELLWITNEQKLYIGDGTTATPALLPVTGFTSGDAQDAAASLFTTATHSGIGFTYDALAGTLTANVDLSNYRGAIRGDINGSVFADNSTLLVDGQSGRIPAEVVQGTFTGSVVGNVSGNLTGNVTGSTTGYHTGDVKGSVFGDDSTALVDAVNSVLNGNVNSNSIVAGSILINKNLTAGGILIQTQGSLNDDYDLLNIQSAHNAVVASGVTYTRSRGTIASPTALNTNDEIFSLVFAGQNSTTTEVAARIDVLVDGSVGSGITPGKLVLKTANSAGAATTRLTIDSKGISTFAGMVQLASYADETAANAAVTTPANGMMYYDTGAGKVKARQGGAWVVLA